MAARTEKRSSDIPSEGTGQVERMEIEEARGKISR
jgi:hypothetical protein